MELASDDHTHEESSWTLQQRLQVCCDQRHRVVLLQRVWMHDHTCSDSSDHGEQPEVGTTTDTRSRSASVRLESGTALARLASNTRQRYSTALLFGSTRQQFRLPAALQAPPMQQICLRGERHLRSERPKAQEKLPLYAANVPVHLREQPKTFTRPRTLPSLPAEKR